MKIELRGVYSPAQSVSTNPTSHGVIAVREHAIEIAAISRVVSGWGMFFELLFLCVLAAMVVILPILMFSLMTEGGGGPLVALLLLPVLAIAVVGVIHWGIHFWWSNWSRPLEIPQMFNRYTGNVHLWVELTRPDITWKNLPDIFNTEARRRTFRPRCFTLRTLPWVSLMVEDYIIADGLSSGGVFIVINWH